MNNETSLFKDLTTEERLRIITLDYAMNSGAKPDEWIAFSKVFHHYIKTGNLPEMPKPEEPQKTASVVSLVTEDDSEE